MRRTFVVLGVLASAFLTADSSVRAEDRADVFPTFRRQEIETGLEVGWSVLVADVNRDGKKDIVVVAPTQVVWCENPSWTPHTLVEAGKFKPNSMTISPIDLNGDGRLQFALGGGWTPKPFDTKAASWVAWLHPEQDAATPWDFSVIGDEPMIHRVRFADVLGEGKPQLLVAPMMGRGSTPENNWADGRPVRLLVYRVPADPARDRWVPEVIDESLSVVHGVSTIERPDGRGVNLLVASYEGIHRFAHDHQAGTWTKRLLTAGNQANPAAGRGTSDVKPGKLKDGRKFLAAIEPWHGNEFVVYPYPTDAAELRERYVVDDQLKYGHAVYCADLDGDGGDEVIVGAMHTLAEQHGSRCGIRLYKALDDAGTRWVRHVLDDGETAVEDLALVDLTGSGKLDIVAVGIQSGKARIFWNQGRP